MPVHPRHRPAFSFVELLVVMMILAILTVALAIAYQRIQLKVRYDANVSSITELFQRARTMSLSTVLINDTEPVEYYLLAVNNHDISLVAQGDTLSETLDTFEYDADMEMSDELEIYYFPPFGEVCLGVYLCRDSSFTGTVETENTTTFSDRTGAYEAEFTITNTGGFVEVEQISP